MKNVVQIHEGCLHSSQLPSSFKEWKCMHLNNETGGRRGYSTWCTKLSLSSALWASPLFLSSQKHLHSFQEGYFTSIQFIGLKITKIFLCQRLSLQKHFIILLFLTTTQDVKSSRLKSTISACWNPWISDIFWELCFLYLHTLLSVLFDTCSYDAAYALITPVSTSHVRCCIIYHPQLKAFSPHHIHHVLACAYLVKV